MNLMSIASFVIKESGGDNRNMSDAHKLAMKLGLTYVKFGRYADPKTGKVVARNIKGHLVKITPDDLEAQKNTPTKTNPHVPRPPLDDYDTTDAYRAAFKPYDDRYHPIGYFTTEYEDGDFLNKFQLEDRPVLDCLIEELDIDPTTRFVHDSEVLEGLSSRMGVYVMGSFSMVSGDIDFHPKVTSGLNIAESLLTPEKLANNYTDPDMISVVTAFHTAVHEMTHAKHRRNGAHGSMLGFEAYGTFINEGLTELRAQKTTHSMLGDSSYLYSTIERSYPREVSAIKWLERRNPELVSKLWDTANDLERFTLIAKHVQEWATTTKQRLVDSGDLTEDEANRMFRAYRNEITTIARFTSADDPPQLIDDIIKAGAIRNYYNAYYGH